MPGVISVQNVPAEKMFAIPGYDDHGGLFRHVVKLQVRSRESSLLA